MMKHTPPKKRPRRRFVERPSLRGCEVQNLVYRGEPQLQIANRERLSDQCLFMPQAMGLILQYFDGEHTVEEIVLQVQADTGIKIGRSLVDELVRKLDAICVLDSPTYHAARDSALAAYRSSGIREPTHAGGAYYAEPERLRDQLRQVFEHPRGAGLPNTTTAPDGALRAVLAPHIDFHRGGPSFGFAFREIAERSDADLFVVVGTSHYSAHRFILTRNDFRTPLGLVKTDKAYVNAIAKGYGEEAAFADELAHLPEHSIEFEVLLLQYVLGGVRNFEVVPVLVGSFQDAVDRGDDPNNLNDVGRMLNVLREVERESGRKVCYIVSGDLAHIGPKFGDPWQIDTDRARWNRSLDADLLARIEQARGDELFNFIADEQDGRRICGFPPSYVMLEAARPKSGKLLYHDQYVDPRGNEIVGFASMAFYT
jgi:AmmeMemoRadiSam system protein B